MNPFDVKTMKRKSKRLQNRRSVIVRGNGVGGAVAEIPVAVGGTVAEAPVGVDDAVEEVPGAESPVAVGGAVAEPPDLVIEEVLDVVATGEGEVLAEGDERDAVDADVGLVVAEDDDVHDQVPSRSRKKLTPREEMKGRLEAAIEDYKEGNHRSIRQCVKEWKITKCQNYHILAIFVIHLILRNGKFPVFIIKFVLKSFCQINELCPNFCDITQN